MNKFNGTIEFLSGQKAAIITLFDNTGEWSGSGRITTNCSSGCNHNIADSLYEIGYTQLSMSAAAKGGILDYYRVVK